MTIQFFDRVGTVLATTGAVTDVTFGAAIDSSYITPSQHPDMADGVQVTYIIQDGANSEIGIGTIKTSMTAMSRDIQHISIQSGVVGTDKIDLSGDAEILLSISAYDMNGIIGQSGRWAKAGEEIHTATFSFDVGDGEGKIHVLNKTTAAVVNLPLLSETVDDVFLLYNINSGSWTLTPGGLDQINNASSLAIPSGWAALVTVNSDRTMWRCMFMGTSSLLGLLRLDAAQTWTLAEQTQGLINLGLDGSRANYRNRLRNSSMSYGVTGVAGIGAPTTGTEIIPGWKLAINTSAGGISAGRVATPTSNGSPYRLQVNCSAADTSIAAGEYVIIFQTIAGREIADLKFGTANAVKLLAKFQVKLPQGTWPVAISNAASTRSIVKTFTISALEANTEVTKTVSFDGDTAGTWLTSYADALIFRIGLTVGSTYQAPSLGVWSAGAYIGHASQSNFLSVNTNVCEIGDLQLVADPSGSGVAPTWQSEPDVINTLRVKRYSPHADIKADGRLTLTFGNVPVTSSDVTGASAVYYAPYTGNQLGLYVGNGWQNFTFEADSLVAITTAASKSFDVWGYLDSNNLVAFDSTVWTSATARATALALQDGIPVKSGDPTRRYIGTVYCDASQQFNDSFTARHVWNMYNRVDRPFRVIDTTDTWTYTTATWRQARASSANQIGFIQGLIEDPIQVEVHGIWANASAVAAAVGIGYDSTSSPMSSSLREFMTNVAGQYGHAAASVIFFATTVGLHTLAWLEWSPATGSTVWRGDDGSTVIQTGLQGKMRG